MQYVQDSVSHGDFSNKPLDSEARNSYFELPGLANIFSNLFVTQVSLFIERMPPHPLAQFLGCSERALSYKSPVWAGSDVTKR